ncbi:MAG TPA: hypothetical protein VMR21_00190, partial [Vicinamibacteria bacterium]|nr:hypothetical protein [Vicinamibacteria bacterium]
SPTVALPTTAPTAASRPAATAHATSGLAPVGVTAAPAGPPPAGPGRTIALALVAFMFLAGIAATAVVLILLRPRETGAPDRLPVTLRSPAVADGGVSLPPSAAPDDVVPRGGAEVVETAPPSRPAALPALTGTTVPPVRPRPPAAAVVAEPEPPAPAPVPAAAPTIPPAAEAPPPRVAFAGAGQVESGERFYEKTLAYALDQPLPFEASVGPVKVRTVQFTLSDRRRFGEIDDLRSEMRAVFPVECRGAGSWQYKVEVELLDESGRRLDRFGDDGRCKDEVKMAAANRGILKALASAVRGVKIRFEASRK